MKRLSEILEKHRSQIIADAERLLSEPETREEPTLVDLPDPFDMNWEWIFVGTDEPADAEAPTATPSVVAGSSRPSWPRRSMSVLALAASLLIGLFLGRGIRPDGDGVLILAAASSVQRVDARGKNEIQLTVRSPFAGHVTAIALAVQRKPLVRPVLGGEDILAPENTPSEPLTLPDTTTKVVFVATPTPAADSVRRFIDDASTRRYAPEDHTDLRKDLERYLASKGFRKMAFGAADVPP